MRRKEERYAPIPGVAHAGHLGEARKHVRGELVAIILKAGMFAEIVSIRVNLEPFVPIVVRPINDHPIVAEWQQDLLDRVSAGLWDVDEQEIVVRRKQLKVPCHAPPSSRRAVSQTAGA